jgi:hypothetical protein
VHAVVPCPGLAPSVRPNRLKFAVVTSSSSPRILAVPAGSVAEETVTKQQATVPRPVSTTADRRARAQQRSHENFLLAERQIRSKRSSTSQQAAGAGRRGSAADWKTRMASIVAIDGTVTDGPYPEAIGGLCVVEVPSTRGRWNGLPRPPAPAAAR